MGSKRKFSLTSLSIMTVLSALGGAVSVPVGYAGNFLSATLLFPLAAPQLLSGIHVFWLVLAALLVPKHGAATFTGACKGLIEAAFVSHLGAIAFILSLVEGLTVDCFLLFLKKDSKVAVMFAGGFSSASNLVVLQLLLLRTLPLEAVGLAYVAAFVSGVFLGSLLSIKIFKAIPRHIL
jgi:ABC-type thiamin/hydroxymethylpyrimidine transport system permease subunit